MGNSFKQIHLRVDDELYEKIKNIANKKGESKSEIMRELLRIGLTEKITEDNTDLIANIVRQQMEIVMKPHVERLAKLSSKTGHMSATAAFLNVQALMDLVSKENKKNVKEMYEKARKKAAEYMHTTTDQYKNNNF